jgi:hypothetical protein
MSQRAPLERLKWSVQALALPAEEQRRLVPDFASATHDLAIEFEVSSEKAFATCPLPDDAAERLRQLYLQLERMSGPERAELWEDDALETRTEWQTVRELAAATLASMGWELAPPPRDRDIYVGPPKE